MSTPIRETRRVNTKLLSAQLKKKLVLSLVMEGTEVINRSDVTRMILFPTLPETILVYITDQA